MPRYCHAKPVWGEKSLHEAGLTTKPRKRLCLTRQARVKLRHAVGLASRIADAAAQRPYLCAFLRPRKSASIPPAQTPARQAASSAVQRLFVSRSRAAVAQNAYFTASETKMARELAGRRPKWRPARWWTLWME